MSVLRCVELVAASAFLATLLLLLLLLLHSPCLQSIPCSAAAAVHSLQSEYFVDPSDLVVKPMLLGAHGSAVPPHASSLGAAAAAEPCLMEPPVQKLPLGHFSQLLLVPDSTW